jgi:hypothetical protein
MKSSQEIIINQAVAFPEGIQFYNLGLFYRISKSCNVNDFE